MVLFINNSFANMNMNANSKHTMDHKLHDILLWEQYTTFLSHYRVNQILNPLHILAIYKNHLLWSTSQKLGGFHLADNQLNNVSVWNIL